MHSPVISIKTYLSLAFALVATVIASHFVPSIYQLFSKSHDQELLIVFFHISVLFILSFLIHHLSKRTIFPSFVVAIFFGMAAHELLATITTNHDLLRILVGIGATFILFSGGLETPFCHFRKHIAKILSLSTFGLLITAILLSFVLINLGSLLGQTVPLVVAILLGAILVSTDPAAIIPVLKTLRFNNPKTKAIAISESAVTDVFGALLTIVFLSQLGPLTKGSPAIWGGSIFTAYTTTFSGAAGAILLKELLFGALFGIFGFGLLFFLRSFTKKNAVEESVDAAYFIFVPIVIYTLAVSFGGSGYLAAFVAGLLFMVVRHMHETEKFFDHMVEGFLKPMIFILLGALVDVTTLIEYAGIGLIASLIFMFFIRPLAVFISLSPFWLISKDPLSWKELLFISFVRETGAIPAVLLVSVVGAGISGIESLLPIGMWVILSTLIIEPPLTPWVALKLGVAKPIGDNVALRLGSDGEPFVVLGSRGHSFARRLPFVTEWATKHHIYHIVLLLCLESRYTQALSNDMKKQAEVEIQKINKSREEANMQPIYFEFVSRKGFLQENIDDISKQKQHVSAIFVGRKVLDYKLEEIKRITVPLVFID